MLRSELATIRDLIVQVQKGAINAARARSELNQMTMRQNNWTVGAYCQSYCRVVTQHHSLEDVAVFPYLPTGPPASPRWKAPRRSTGGTSWRSPPAEPRLNTAAVPTSP